MQQVLEPTPGSSLILSNSLAIHPINAVTPEIAGTEIPVLLSGESGIGKEVYARWIHRPSKHSNGPFNEGDLRNFGFRELSGAGSPKRPER